MARAYTIWLVGTSKGSSLPRAAFTVKHEAISYILSNCHKEKDLDSFWVVKMADGDPEYKKQKAPEYVNVREFIA